MTDQQHTTTSSRPTRRSLVKGAAWAVPAVAVAAVAVAAAAPKAAASPVCVPVLSEQSCKRGNHYHYRLRFRLPQTGYGEPCRNCSLRITGIYNLSGTALWTGSEGADDSIYICQQLPATIRVTGAVRCGGRNAPWVAFPDQTMSTSAVSNSACRNFPGPVCGGSGPGPWSADGVEETAGSSVEYAEASGQEPAVLETPAEASTTEPPAPVVEPETVVDSPVATG